MSVNIAKIMKYAPKGVKLYSPLFGEIVFVGVDCNDCIVVDVNGATHRFYSNGKYWDLPTALCLLFPSKESADWNNWAEVFSEDPACQGCCITMDVPRAEMIVSGQHYCGDGSHGYIATSSYFNSWAVRFASPEETRAFLERLEKHGFIWNSVTKSVEKKEAPKSKHFAVAEFKPKDWVLVRDCDGEKWELNRFGFYDECEMFPFICIGNCYKQCIPYEQNRNLLGTKDTPEEKYINW